MKPLPFLHNNSHRSDYLLLIVLTLAIYARALGHEFQLSWDDNWYLVYNESIRGFSWQNLKTIFSSIYQANYAPLQMLSYMLDYSLWGLNPAGFLATNILLHTLNGLLLYRLLLSLHGERLLALVAAAFFLVHPLQVESVAWISCRKNVLSLLFLLLSFEAYRRYKAAEPGRGTMAYLSSLAAFVLSLMAKSTTLVLPLMLVLYDVCFPAGKRRLSLADKTPYVIAAVIFALISMHFQSTDYQGGIRMPYHGGSPLTTVYTMLPVFCLYLWRLVWPAGLSAIYAPPVHTTPDATVLAAALLLAAVAWCGVRLFKSDRRLCFWLMFFWIGLLPFAQIVPILWLITDRYINVSIIGAAALAGAGAVYLRNRTGIGGARILYATVALWIIALSVTSFQRVGIWKDSLTLWSDTVAKQPTDTKALACYAEALRFSGQMDTAREVYEKGLAVDPDDLEILAGLGDLYTAEGQLDKGLPLLQKLLQKHPSHAIGWAALGTNYMKRGNFVEAEKAYKQAQKVQPEAWQVVMLLGNLALAQGRLEQARIYYTQVEARGYNNPQSAYQLACVESLAGHRDEALAWLEKAFQRGFSDYNKLHDDLHLSALWQEPRFMNLLQQYVP